MATIKKTRTASKPTKKTVKTKKTKRKSTPKAKSLGNVESKQKILNTLIELQEETKAVRLILKKSRRKSDKATVAVLEKIIKETEKDKQVYLKKLKK